MNVFVIKRRILETKTKLNGRQSDTFLSAYSYRLSDTHDSMNCEAIHLLSLDMFSEQLQHG